MRILITTDTYHPRGDGSSVFNQRLALGLKKRGHDVLVIAPSLTVHTEEREHAGIRILGVRSFPLPGCHYRYAPPFGVGAMIEKAIRSFRPDIGHFSSHFSPNTAVLPILKRLRVPTIGSNHFIPDNLLPYLHLPHVVLPAMRRLFWMPFKRIYRQFDVVSAPTNTAAEIMRAQMEFRHLIVTSNGVDTTVFRPENDGEELRKRLNLPNGIPLLLSLCRLDQEKRIPVMLRAMKLLPRALPCILLIAGKGSQEAKLKALHRELDLGDRVRFLGFVPDSDVPALYALSTAFITASTAELQSIATLEAMATGKPVIGANALALPELIHDGENGYLFAPDDAEALSERIQALLANPNRLEMMGQRSKAIALTHDLAKTISRFEEVYRGMRDRESGSA